MAASSFSFDVVSKVEIPELDNALNQARREIDTRFDFKGTGSRIEGGRDGINVFSSDEYHLQAAITVLEERLVRREVPLEGDIVEPGRRRTEGNREAGSESPPGNRPRQGARDNQIHQEPRQEDQRCRTAGPGPRNQQEQGLPPGGNESAQGTRLRYSPPVHQFPLIVKSVLRKDPQGRPAFPAGHPGLLSKRGRIRHPQERARRARPRGDRNRSMTRTS